MTIEPLAGIAPTTRMVPSAPVVSSTSVDFSSLMADSVQDLNGLVRSAEVAAEGYAKGEIDNIHQVMISLSKAQTAFDLTVQVRNRAVDTVQEFLRMSI